MIVWSAETGEGGGGFFGENQTQLALLTPQIAHALYGSGIRNFGNQKLPKLCYRPCFL